MTAAVRTTQRAYPAYKDSGIEWLGEIPEHWKALPVKRVAILAYGDSLPAEKRTEGDVEVFGSNGSVGTHDQANTQAPVIIVGRKGSFGKLTYSSQPGFAIDTTYFIDKRYTSTNLRWLFYAMGCLGLDSQSKDSAVPGLSREEAYAKVVPLPPLPEQEAIARFLDHKTAQIDALIAKKEALLARLADKRTALISQAVTQGLDPTVPMRDSGIEWLGEIPEHWEVLPLKYAVTFQRGHDLPSEQRNEGTVPLVSSSGVSALHDRAKASGPGIVTGRYGTIGKFTYIEEDYWPLNTTLYSIDTYSNNVRFLWYMLHNIAPLFILNSQKSAVPGVDRNDLHPVPTTVPPVSEQDEIVRYLDSHLAQIDKQSKKVQTVIDKLKQYRTALITNAVTGKIDVREAGAWATEAPTSS